VPSGFKGKYQVKVEEYGPFEWKSEDTWYEIK